MSYLLAKWATSSFPFLKTFYHLFSLAAICMLFDKKIFIVAPYPHFSYMYFPKLSLNFWHIFGKIRIFVWNNVLIKKGGGGQSNKGGRRATKGRHNLIAILSFTQERCSNHNFQFKESMTVASKMCTF